MRRICLLVTLFFLGSLSTYAQLSDPGPFQGLGGYSYTRFDTSPVTTSAARFNGFELSGQYRFRNWLGGVADFGGSAGNLGIAPRKPLRPTGISASRTIRIILETSRDSHYFSRYCRSKCSCR